MKVVILDGYTLNPGDLSWATFEQFGDVSIYDNTSSDQLVERIGKAEAVLTNKVVLRNEHLDQLPNLRYVGVTATGFNVIDIGQARSRGIVVTNAPHYGTDSVAQHVFALILESTNNVGQCNLEVHQGLWQKHGYWSYSSSVMTELSGKCLGIVGMGAIGQRVAQIGEVFGMEIIYASPSSKDVPYAHVDLKEVFKRADYLSLHCPLTDATNNLVNRETLDLMKTSAVLINTGRGQLVNESDLHQALSNQRIAGAALDVLSEEPPANNILLTAPNCIITGHNAWATKEARQRLMVIVEENLRQFVNGSPVNVVS